ncbi:unnamed protein product, partial [Brenthis ino]
MLNDSLKMENVSKERDIPKTDAEVLTDICCLGMQCGDVEPVKEVGARCEDAVCYEDSNRRVKQSSPSVSVAVVSLRQENVSLRHELVAARGVLAALDEQCRVAGLRARFKDEVILEMRRQLRQAKAKLKELSEAKLNVQKDREGECHNSQQRRKCRERPDADLATDWDCCSTMYESDVSSKG